MVYDLRVEVLEAVKVGFEVEWFRVSGEGACCFDDDEVVNLMLELMHANLEPVKLGVYENEVVDFAARCAVGVGCQVVGGAKRFSLVNGQEASRRRGW